MNKDEIKRNKEKQRPAGRIAEANARTEAQNAAREKKVLEALKQKKEKDFSHRFTPSIVFYEN